MVLIIFIKIGFDKLFMLVANINNTFYHIVLQYFVDMCDYVMSCDDHNMQYHKLIV